MIWMTVLAVVICFVVTLVIGKIAIPMLHKLKYGQQVRDDGPQTHLKKAGTPTMGGVVMLIALLFVVFFDITNITLWLAVAFTIGFGVIGFIDDYIKIVKKRSMGLSAIQKIIMQFILAGLMAFYASRTTGTVVWIPFVNKLFDMGSFYVPFMMFVVIGAVNSVNLTDGLDGLATSVMLIIMAAYTIILFNLSKAGILKIGDINAMMYFSGGLIGCLMGFLKYNLFPAKVFMGDTGSLALGGALSFVALCSNTVLLLPIMGGCFVMSALSVIIQVASFKLTGKRVFKMAPLHHHFELMGMHETKVVGMYIVITIGLCFLGLLAIVI